MKVSTKGRYALRLMVDIALHSGGEFVTLKDISKRQNISLKYLEQIVPQLTRSGMLKSNRGPQGGYKLAREAAKYTAGDILRVTEGSLAPVSCAECGESDCDMYGICPTADFWKQVYDAILNVVDNTTLEALSEQTKRKLGNENDYVI